MNLRTYVHTKVRQYIGAKVQKYECVEVWTYRSGKERTLKGAIV